MFFLYRHTLNHRKKKIEKWNIKSFYTIAYANSMIWLMFNITKTTDITELIGITDQCKDIQSQIYSCIA